MMNYENTREFAQAQDAADSLRAYRDEFHFPLQRDGRSNIYLCGNSLGLQSRRAAEIVEEVLEEWRNRAVEGHFRAARPWMPYHRNANSGLASLTGAREREVIAMNTLTVNLHLMMTTFYRPQGKRHKILIESTAFPSDRFAVSSQLRLHGHDPDDALLEWVPRDDEALHMEDLDALTASHRDEIALIMLPGIQYYNGQVLDMEAIVQKARECGCNVGLDLAHAIGNVPLDLHNWAPDFAVWCNYKYVNGGPGSVGGAFVHSQHLDADGTEQLLGWWSHDEATRFLMAPTFTPAKGAELWQISNPAVLSLAPVLASLEMFEEIGIDKLHEKTVRLTGYLDYLLQENFEGRVGTITPADARGCQLSLVVTQPDIKPKTVFNRLQDLNVTADWREPNVIRAAPAPMYNNFEDAFEFSERLKVALGD